MNPIAIPWDSPAAWPLLAVLQLLPLLGALVVLALRRGSLATFAGVILASFELLLAILLYRGYDPA
jgi:NADH-quinone oxidoreductase subunit M